LTVIARIDLSSDDAPVPPDAVPDRLSNMAVVRRLRDDWGLQDITVTEHHGGMNSRTWYVEGRATRLVAKAVPSATQPSFSGGLRVAALVEAAAIPAGAPVPTRDGRLIVTVDEHALALLSYVPGEPLVGTSVEDRRLIGLVLARVHRATVGADHLDADRFHWLDPAADHLAVRAWIRPAVVGALARYEALVPGTLTSGLLHTDPAPEAFRLDGETGRCGLIDWDRALVGPLLYDLASAVLYVGGPERGGPLVEAYVVEGVMDRSEVERGLIPMLTFRWAVQADYFARRLATNDLTGITGPEDNDKGIEDARRELAIAQAG
jgi:homoserine kinase type II